jgi:hypothetical protein
MRLYDYVWAKSSRPGIKASNNRASRSWFGRRLSRPLVVNVPCEGLSADLGWAVVLILHMHEVCLFGLLTPK